jgi:hypothetical protein
MRAAALLAAALVTAAATAQDSRPDAAALHRLVDRRIEELRAELHKDIDEALGRTCLPGDRFDASLGVTSQAVSEEFRAVHRLAPGSGRRIESVIAGGWAQKLGLVRGDVVVGCRIESSYPTVRLIRSNEHVTVVAPRAEETAGQMVDRLWDQAVRDAMKGSFEEVRPRNPVSESQPVPK